MRLRSVPAWIEPVLRPVGGLLLLGLLVIGCASPQHAGERGLPETRGEASYYADKYVGRTTANGEIYDPKALTAAHRSLPFGTRVRVTRVDAPKQPAVVVQINDRGPFEDERIIDLSETAARRLRMLQEGVVEVKLEVVSYPEGAKTSSPDSLASDSTGADSSGVAW